eukprot:41031-Eustigmatos_ZCMA.PRE.1
MEQAVAVQDELDKLRLRLNKVGQQTEARTATVASSDHRSCVFRRSSSRSGVWRRNEMPPFSVKLI